MKDLRCTGEEMDVGECAWSPPDAACAGHEADSIVYCGVMGGPLWEGAARLLGTDGAPSLSGEGLLQVFADGQWSSVCGLDSGAATVACKAMGFAGAAGGSSAAGHAWMSGAPGIGELSCGGSEHGLRECSFQHAQDVFCAPAEAAIISCSGSGETIGRPSAGWHRQVSEVTAGPKCPT